MPASETTLNQTLACRYTQEETMSSTVEQRNECNSKSGGFSFAGIGTSTSSTKCSTFDANSNDWGSTAVRRMEHKTYGVLPSEGVNISF